jgi:hypothetical protein
MDEGRLEAAATALYDRYGASGDGRAFAETARAAADANDRDHGINGYVVDIDGPVFPVPFVGGGQGSAGCCAAGLAVVLGDRVPMLGVGRYLHVLELGYRGCLYASLVHSAALRSTPGPHPRLQRRVHQRRVVMLGHETRLSIAAALRS